MNHNLLVTGGAGFIGTNFVRYWLQSCPKDRVIVLDALTYAGRYANLKELEENPRFAFVKGRIEDQALCETLLKQYDIDTIVNFAAESHVDRSIEGPGAFVQTNVVGTHALLKAARNVWLSPSGKAKQHRFHHVSTDEVFGSLGPEAPAFSEDSPYRPNSPYAASKASADHLVRAYHHTYGLNTTISNCSNNYGPYQFPEKLIPLMVVNILAGRNIPVYGDGLNVRDWLYVADHCRAIKQILQMGESGAVYTVGGNNEWRNIEIVRLICGLLDAQLGASPALMRQYPLSPASRGRSSQTLITFVEDRPGHDRRYAVNAEKIRTELGFVPKESFESGLGKTLQWYLKNRDWWQVPTDQPTLRSKGITR
ncbi:MAG: dTDP-glucose 4,6-dehydratase [Desulfobacterales bacterium]|nr:dTDP-glucose 4,6-dehydratase [Desulfobacterales bacterium]